MKIEHLAYLVAVDDCHSIHEASRRLLLKPQYVSNVVKGIEEEFGTKIFERTPRGVVPTENGKYLLGKARGIVDLYDEMGMDFLYPENRANMKGPRTITVYMREAMGGTGTIATFSNVRERLPNIDFAFKSKPLKKIIAALGKDPDAMGFVYFLPEEEKEIPEGITAVDVATVNMAVYASGKNERARRMNAISLEDAAKLGLVVYAPSGLKNSMTYELLHEHGDLDVKYLVDNASMLFSLLGKGDYYCVASEGIRGMGDLVRIPFVETDETTLTVRALYDGNQENSRLLARIAKLITPHYSTDF